MSGPRRAFINMRLFEAGGSLSARFDGRYTGKEICYAMNAIVTVIGKDRVGIIAEVCSLLAQRNINILDITQTVLQDYFTMVMLVDTAACEQSVAELSDILHQAGEDHALSIRIQREDIFNTMHRI